MNTELDSIKYLESGYALCHGTTNEFGMIGTFFGPVIIVGALHVWYVIVKRGKQEGLSNFMVRYGKNFSIK